MLYILVAFCLGIVIVLLADESRSELIRSFKFKQLIRNYQKNRYSLVKDVFGLVVSVFFIGIFSYKIINSDELSSLRIVLLIITVLIISFFLFLSFFDLHSFSIPANSTIAFIVFLLLINFLVLALYKSISIIPGNSFSPVMNLLAAVIAGGFIGVIVLITKEKGMGKGDILVAVAMGLTLGIKTVVAFYIAIFSATLIGLVYALFTGKLKGVKLPFVPFLTLGALISLVFWTEITAILPWF